MGNNTAARSTVGAAYNMKRFVEHSCTQLNQVHYTEALGNQPPGFLAYMKVG
jgi:hypothetical protein